jgi:hypothetical protein
VSQHILIYQDAPASSGWALRETIIEPYLHFIPSHRYAVSLSYSAGGRVLAVGVPGDQDAGSVFMYGWDAAGSRTRIDPPYVLCCAVLCCAVLCCVASSLNSWTWCVRPPTHLCSKPYNVNGLVRQSFGAAVFVTAATINATIYNPLNATIVVAAPGSGVGCVISGVLYTLRSYNASLK